MGYYDDPTGYNARGIDYDLIGAIENNHPGFEVDDIAEVLAVIEGENDGESWRWLLKMKGGDYILAEGWCDYTGWDCQSGMSIESTGKHALDALGCISEKSVYDELFNQLDEGEKTKTWREKTDNEFAGVLYGVDLAKIKQANNRDNLLNLITKRLPTNEQLLKAKADGEAQARQVQPYAPDYEVETMTSFDAIMVTAYLLRSGIWFCVRPVEDNHFEVVVKYADRAEFKRFVDMT